MSPLSLRGLMEVGMVGVEGVGRLRRGVRGGGVCRLVDCWVWLVLDWDWLGVRCRFSAK